MKEQCIYNTGMVIRMPRGDIRPVNFTVISEGDDCELIFDEIYFTVKTNTSKDGYLFQKRLSTGDIEQMEDKTYQFVIEPEDTNGLKYGRYTFDIELVIGVDLKQTFVGLFELTDEVTFATNEVV